MCSHIGGSGSWKECGIAASDTCNPGLPQSAAHDNSLSTWQILQETPKVQELKHKVKKQKNLFKTEK